ncbi:MAG: LacI family DNA-binding transcriptional regulator [Aeriscardovia sp.]|nr:LacI family DNA-binding transcriptional regulator [Aeriscardovia sp.]
MEQNRAKIQDVAALAHTSISTVSRVLDGGKNVDPRTREKVEEAIGQLGYIPSAPARAMRLGHTHLAGLLVPDMTSGYHALLSQTIKASLFKRGYLTLIATTFGDPSTQRSYISSFISQRVDGLIILSSFFPDPLQLSSLKKIPAVFLDTFLEKSKIPTINQEVAGAVKDALKDLRFYRHQKVGYLPGPVGKLPLLGEYQGALEAAAGDFFASGAVEVSAKTEISVMSSYADFLQTPGSPQDASLGFKRRCEKVEGILDALLARGVTAVIAGYGPDALAAYLCLRGRGIPIGQGGVSVISFDHVSMGDFLSPPLSSIEVPVGKMGLMASESLERVMEGEIIENRKVEAAYVHRQSVGLA